MRKRARCRMSARNSPFPLRISSSISVKSSGRSAPTVVEIGFGMGESTAAIAALKPETNFLGLEVHSPGSAHRSNFAKKRRSAMCAWCSTMQLRC